MQDERMRDPDDVFVLTGRVIRLLPAIGTGLISASAIGALVGGLYLSAFFEAAHAGWAMDEVGYGVIIRVGLIGAGAFAVAVTAAMALVLTGSTSLRMLYSLVAFHTVAVLGLIGVRLYASPMVLTHDSAGIDLGIMIFGAHALAAVVAVMAALRVDSAAMRGRLIAMGLFLGGFVCVIAPLQRGYADGTSVLTGDASGYHPDVCIKGDPAPWRLIRVFDSRALVARASGPMKDTMRLIENTQLDLLLPTETNGGSTQACAALAGKKG